ncbi:hypothetical protein CYMTET_34830 [Cymbomonas tetramitiformis]|uniref:Uncharacterized protein n=1 Tax=Cymbomonas tetramitiformis TaxID=36881 RepID=A0AAE0FAH2_9CHLO|nr:hypothetical protein CYMTET_34830 [Cymbomonas tetramitiformis]
MQDYEEEDEFDLAAFDEVEAFENLNRELQENDDYDTDDEDGGLQSDDFLASVKVKRLGATTAGPFTEHEISEVGRLLKTVLLQSQKSVAIFSVEGKKYPDSATPFMHVKVASIEEARVLVEYAVVVADGQDFLITPKSSKLTSITLGFKAYRAGKQPRLALILNHIKASPFSKFIKEITFQQTFTVNTRAGGEKKRSRLVRQIFVQLKTGLGRHSEPARIDRTNKDHAMYALPLEYHWSGLGTVFISKCSALICRSCEGRAANGHSSKNCPVKIYGLTGSASQPAEPSVPPAESNIPPGFAEGTDQSTGQKAPSRAPQRHGGHPRNCRMATQNMDVRYSETNKQASPSQKEKNADNKTKKISTSNRRKGKENSRSQMVIGPSLKDWAVEYEINENSCTKSQAVDRSSTWSVPGSFLYLERSKIVPVPGAFQDRSRTWSVPGSFPYLERSRIVPVPGAFQDRSRKKLPSRDRSRSGSRKERSRIASPFSRWGLMSIPRPWRVSGLVMSAATHDTSLRDTRTGHTGGRSGLPREE